MSDWLMTGHVIEMNPARGRVRLQKGGKGTCHLRSLFLSEQHTLAALDRFRRPYSHPTAPLSPFPGELGPVSVPARRRVSQSGLPSSVCGHLKSASMPASRSRELSKRRLACLSLSDPSQSDRSCARTGGNLAHAADP
jgi:hypothetical protein